MTPPRTPVVEHDTLTLGRQLGQGGQGTVYQVPNKKINEADGGGWDVAYKEYGAAVLPDLDAAALASRVDLLGELSAAEGRWLCDKTAWPAAVVERQGSACGFLMRAVPDRFHFTFRSLTGTTSGTRRLANLEFLLNDDSYVAGIGLAVSERDRLVLLADLAATLARLHRIGITVGDLSPKNLLFTTDPQPECFLIDSDAMRLRGVTVLPQAETPDWQVPAGEEKATRASDVYKLALLAIRLFARDQTATDPAALTALSPQLGDLARSGLNPDPARRPTPAVWAEQLTAASTTASTTPVTAPGRRRASGRPSAPSSPRPGTGHPPRTTSPTTGATGPVQNPGARAAAGVIAAIAALILVVVVIGNNHDSSDTASDTSSPYTPSASSYSPDPDPTTYSPYPDPTTYSPEPDPTTYSPEPDPTTYSPEPDPPTYSPAPPPPPPQYYGSIAVGRDGSMGKAWDYRSVSAADQGALSRCSGVGCKVLVSFVNGCGAIAFNPNTNQYWGGRGDTATEAEQNAISHAGGGRWLTYVCTTRY
ncbi:DUF4189 domain-containing protein [Streptomyces sp. NPDC048506]|uniref:DUF4189 domain-containing protein n=1 Tax=Streptomyces sp. NPDC048506 TaxID=3155028 RepID=UPI00343F70FE